MDEMDVNDRPMDKNGARKRSKTPSGREKSTNNVVCKRAGLGIVKRRSGRGDTSSARPCQTPDVHTIN